MTLWTMRIADATGEAGIGTEVVSATMIGTVIGIGTETGTEIEIEIETEIATGAVQIVMRTMTKTGTVTEIGTGGGIAKSTRAMMVKRGKENAPEGCRYKFSTLTRYRCQEGLW